MQKYEKLLKIGEGIEFSNFEIKQAGKSFPIIKNDEEWNYKRGTSVYKIKPLK